MHALNIGAMVIHRCGFIFVIAVLSAMGMHHSAAFIFTFASESVRIILSMVSGLVDYIIRICGIRCDCTLVGRDEKCSPRALFGSVVVSGILTFPYIAILMIYSLSLSLSFTGSSLLNYSSTLLEIRLVELY
jgi:hypothetical protein